MDTQTTNADEDSSFRSEVDATKLWAGGIATAVVAGLVALVGVLAFRWAFGVPILARTEPALMSCAHDRVRSHGRPRGGHRDGPHPSAAAHDAAAVNRSASLN